MKRKPYRIALRTQLTLGFLALSVLIVGVMSISANLLLKNRFEAYAQRQQELRNEGLVRSLLSQAVQKGVWSPDALETLGVGALEAGQILRVSDPQGTVIWDATAHHNGLCVQMLESMANNMRRYDRSFQGEYTEFAHPLYQDGAQIGTVQIGYYGPFSYTNSEIVLIGALNNVLTWVGVAALLAAVVMGALMARGMARALAKVSGDAQTLTAQLGLQTTSVPLPDVAGDSRIREIAQLASSIRLLCNAVDQQQALRKRMTTDMAHELRTPLTTLQTHLEAMMDGIWEATPQRLATLHEEIGRLTRMVGELERLAQLEGDSLTLQLSQTDVAALAGAHAARFENAFAKNQIAFCAQLTPCTITCDSDRIGQVLVNLLDNALKYTPQGGRVRLAVSPNEGGALLEVFDSGEPIAKEHIPHLFERFYRVDESRNRLTGGMGIGLSVVQAIVRAHGGTVGVRNLCVGEGGGKVFEVDLPGSAIA